MHPPVHWGKPQVDVARTQLTSPAIPRGYRKGPTVTLHVTVVTVVTARHTVRHCVTARTPVSIAGSLTASQAPGSKCHLPELLKPVLERTDGERLRGDDGGQTATTASIRRVAGSEFSLRGEPGGAEASP